MYHGAYPTASMLKNLLETIQNPSHNDWIINNMVLQGNKLTLIDIDDPSHNPGGPGGGNSASIKEIVVNHYNLMDIADPTKVEHYFWNYLIRLPVKNRHRNKFVKKLIKKGDLIFDIGSVQGTYAHIYLSNHAYVIAVESDIKNVDILHQLFDYNDQITILPKRLTDAATHSDAEITLQELIATYGTPNYCSLNVKNSKTLILNLNKPLGALSFPFTMTNFASIEQCIRHLASLGYQQFNFSCRAVPLYMITEWVKPETILEKLKECAHKDHEGNLMWGFIHAKLSDK